MSLSNIESFVSACKELGLKVTPQRIAVYETLKNRTDHPTVEEIYIDVKEKQPFVSLATVYRTLETLEELGLIRRVAYFGNSVRYDANVSHHHHLICLSCGAISDVELNISWTPPEEIMGYKVNTFGLNLFGICPKCQTKS
ncbi:MAG: transcriptional repressor [Aquificaceae bacterium]|nr:transcriptional repressor [Aquificaceae bacterium]MDW8236942.1 Fur family transcriptional regulator [Aquificaceae bacterium]